MTRTTVPTFRREYVFVGTTAAGERVLMTGEIRHADQTSTTVTHEDIEAPATLSLTSDVFTGKKNIGRNHVVSGATLEHLGRITRPAPGFTLEEARELHDLGKWHLNDMRPACAHMEVPEGKTGTELLDMGIVCLETGYKWGHSWLVEPLPADVEARFIELMSKGATEIADF
ncbi:hypothetical protein ACH4S8_38040 [Streptomyces sp. NPDC021080]|uniref:hypothetical protein n=1 Tax=Streptomyces sp. NPDC021080 TaxID=3365110 RepID=UPI0037B80F1F